MLNLSIDTNPIAKNLTTAQAKLLVGETSIALPFSRVKRSLRACADASGIEGPNITCATFDV